MRTIAVELKERVETGPLRFNQDWPGVFIRGDECQEYARVLENVMLYGAESYDFEVLDRLRELLLSSQVGANEGEKRE